jgi:hypothetical protein
MNSAGQRGLVVLAILWFLVALTAHPGDAAEKQGKGRTVTPFSGKNLDGWTLKGPEDRSQWTVGKAKIDPDDPRRLVVSPVGDAPGELINAEGHGVDIFTKEKYGDCTIRLELMVPQGSNSGVYVMGEYEIQVLDSFGRKELRPGDLGGLYGVAAPRVNASKRPGEWQEMVIEFQAPRFADGKKTANARFLKVTLNGQVIHENVEMASQTPGGLTGKEVPAGPLMFQGNHGAVAYRNIRITLPATP